MLTSVCKCKTWAWDDLWDVWYNLKKETDSTIDWGTCGRCGGHLGQGRVVYYGDTYDDEEIYYHQEEVPYISELYPERFA